MARSRKARTARQRPAYLRMLAGVFVLYTIIIGFADEGGAAPLRILLLGFLLWNAMRVRGAAGWRWWTIGLTAAALAVTVWADIAASPRVAGGVVGGASLALTAAVLGTIAFTLLGWRRMDTATVLGVLCAYLLLALLFAAVHELLASFSDHYLNGAPNPPTASDLLYFSVITMATVGYGDITPASESARSVAVTEALVGQLYLVSVVAAVVGGWRAAEHRP
jgi:Ion channel